MKTVVTLAALTLPLMLPMIAAAQAQAVWRCGADGRSYQSAPCADGRAVEVAEARPQSDLRFAQEQAAREIRLAEQLSRERQALEARERGNGIGGFQTAHTAAKPQVRAVRVSRPLRERSRLQAPEADDTWRATGPASRRRKG